ncbi:MAG: hypothetical protein NT107_09360, partial [Planctomycetota bacterium]|nr:hypothetical protein [Planctomycetota bacterium]
MSHCWVGGVESTKPAISSRSLWSAAALNWAPVWCSWGLLPGGRLAWRYTKAPLRVALHQGTPARGATPRHPCAWRYTKTPLRVALHQGTPARGATPRHPCAWRYTKTPLREALHKDT